MLDALFELLSALTVLIAQTGALILPWTPLIAWIVFWTFGANWTKLRETLAKGGWIGVFLIALVMVIIWGAVAPPPDGMHNFPIPGTKASIPVSNLVEKAVYVSGLLCIMLLCGAVQLSGCCASCCQFADEPEEATPAH